MYILTNLPLSILGGVRISIDHQPDDVTDDDHEDGIGLKAGGGDEG